jgi:hypothetical protein
VPKQKEPTKFPWVGSTRRSNPSEVATSLSHVLFAYCLAFFAWLHFL